MRAKGLKIDKKKPDVQEKEDLGFTICKWLIKACIAIPFVGAAAQCAEGFLK